MKRLIDFSCYSSIKIGPKVEVEIIQEIDAVFEEYFLVGGANNLLISPSPPPLAKLGKNFDYIKREGEYLFIGGATPTGKVVSFCKKENIGGLEFLSHLPGTIGGAVKMNAGVKEYEIKNALVAITTYQGQEDASSLGLDYRKSNIEKIIYEAIFKIHKGFNEKLRQNLLALRKNQPKVPSAGSCFKNPPNDYAGRLLEAVGLKGFKREDMAFSDMHANFLVNLRKGNFEDALYLINLAKKRVFEEFGIELEEEVILL